MHRSNKIDFYSIRSLSNSDDEDHCIHDVHVHGTQQSTSSIDYIRPLKCSNPVVDRLTLLPAYPTFDRFGPINRDHLLLANVSYQELTCHQQWRRSRRHLNHQPFMLTNQSMDINAQPFFINIHHELYEDLTKRFQINDAILDYNYERLHDCINIMTQERIHYGLLPKHMVGIYEFRLAEYALAIEFYLQMDDELFFMKTCSFRDAQPSLYKHYGIFSLDPPEAHYGMTPCENIACRFCFPIKDVLTCGRQNQPVVQFSTAQKHRFVNGYEVILNCPTSCTTRNILYALTCPCGQYDYIGYTSGSLDEQLAYHREHGNRIIHEFILGSENIRRIRRRRQQPKSETEFNADEMLLYKHSARCPSAIQMFLDCNPQYWCFVPMPKAVAQEENLASHSPSNSIRLDSTSTSVSDVHTYRDKEASSYVRHLPPMPSENYTFSLKQRKKQFQIFKNKLHHLMPNAHLDLYNATIVVVLPDQCTELFYRLIEALFITHAQSKLNTLGHLDGMIVENNNSNDVSARTVNNRRDDWCRNLVRRPTISLPDDTRIRKSYRKNPHFQ